MQPAAKISSKSDNFPWSQLLAAQRKFRQNDTISFSVILPFRSRTITYMVLSDKKTNIFQWNTNQNVFSLYMFVSNI